MKKKPTEKREAIPKYDSKREQNVLLEKVYSEVKTIGEGHESLVKRLDSVEAHVGLVKMAVMDISGDVKILKDDVRLLKKGQEDLKASQEGLKKNQEDFAYKVDRIEQKLDTVTANHENRIISLEPKIS